MNYTDAELKDATQVAYKDFSREIKRLEDGGKKSPPYTIGELCKEKGVTVESVFPDMDSRDVAKWKIVDYYDNNDTTGFFGCLIETEPGKAIIAFRGSEAMEDKDHGISNTIHDWGEADLGLMNKTLTKQQGDVEKFLKKIADSDYIDQYDFIATTGHSLGGNLAMHATVISSDSGLSNKIQQCASFDGPGFSGEYIQKNKELIDREGDKITHYQWSLVGKMLNELPGVPRTKLEYEADDTFTRIAGRHDTKYILFDRKGNAIRNPNGPEGWEYLDEISNLFSKGLDHMPGIIGNGLVFVTSSLLYVAVWSGHNFYDQEGNLTLYGQSVIAAGAALLIFNPVATITFVIEAVVIVVAFFVAVCLYEIVYEAVEKIVAIVVDAAIEFYHMAAEAAEKFKQYVAQKLREFKEWCQKTFNAGYKYASQHTCIQIDTDKMRQYGAILREVNRKLNEIDRRMDRLYRSLKLGDQAKLMRADIRTGYSLRLGRCASYLEDTASEFATVESNLIKIL